jgi:uncharacterized protein
MQELVENNFSKIVELCVEYKVERLILFGSATGNVFSGESDIDFLVTFGAIPLLEYSDYFFDFKEELEALLKRNIDLVTEKSLTNPYLIDSINQNKILLYERANQEVPV